MISPPSESCDQLMVTWTASTITGIKYRITLNGTVNISSLDTTSITLVNLMANTIYNVAVVAFKGNNDFGNATGINQPRPEVI